MGTGVTAIVNVWSTAPVGADKKLVMFSNMSKPRGLVLFCVLTLSSTDDAGGVIKSSGTTCGMPGGTVSADTKTCENTNCGKR